MPHLSRFKLPPRARKVPRPKQPDGIRMRYYAELRPFLYAMREVVNNRVRPILKELVDRHAERTGQTTGHHDAMPPGKRALNTIHAASRSITNSWPNERLSVMAAASAKATSKFNKEQLFAQIKGSIQIDVGTMMDKGIAARLAMFNAENVSLIRSVQARYFAKVEQVVLAGISSGARATDIQVDLTDAGITSESNALRIARDQIGKLNGQLNQVRQEQLGIDGFTWRTMHDGRVREEHEELDGKTFTWDDPPDEGIPGEPVNCRCFAEPNLADLLDAE